MCETGGTNETGHTRAELNSSPAPTFSEAAGVVSTARMVSLTREERDGREGRDRGLVYLVPLAYLFRSANQRNQKNQIDKRDEIRTTAGASPRRLWRRPFLRAHESVTDRASLAWRPSFATGSTAAARGEWRSTASPFHLQACRLGERAGVLRLWTLECPRNQSVSRVYA